MAIFRPGVRQGALQASRQGTLGQFLGAHPRAQAQWNRAAQGNRAGAVGGGFGRQQMLGGRNDMSLGQAAGGRPMPIAGPMGMAQGGSPAPPTQQMPPGAQYRGPQMSTLGGMSPFQMGSATSMPQFGQTQGNPYAGTGYGYGGMPGQNAGGYGFNPYGGGAIGGTMNMNYQGPSTYQGPMSPALQGLMGQVNPGMQSVIGSRLGQMGYGTPGPMNNYGGYGNFSGGGGGSPYAMGSQTLGGTNSPYAMGSQQLGGSNSPFAMGSQQAPAYRGPSPGAYGNTPSMGGGQNSNPYMSF